MDALEIIMGHEVDNIKPYATNNVQATVFSFRKCLISFIKKEINNSSIAKYPTSSVA